jgi:hypothetical protein
MKTRLIEIENRNQHNANHNLLLVSKPTGMNQPEDVCGDENAAAGQPA